MEKLCKNCFKCKVDLELYDPNHELEYQFAIGDGYESSSNNSEKKTVYKM
jgi:hypothetical protein